MKDHAEGGCLCGAVRYRVEGESAARTLCHCDSCRRAAGGPSVAWAVFAKDAVVFTAGAPALYASSPGVVRGFCARCGTSLTWSCEDKPGQVDLTTASFDDPERFAPTREIWTEERLSWVARHPDLPQYLRSSAPPARPV